MFISQINIVLIKMLFCLQFSAFEFSSFIFIFDRLTCFELCCDCVYVGVFDSCRWPDTG